MKFIPPEGAMQFEFIPNGKSDHESMLTWNERDMDFVWVEGPLPGIGRCGHKRFPVLIDSLSPPTRAKVVSQPRRVFVCQCMGRIIE